MSLIDEITFSYEEFQQSLIDEGDNVTPILRNRELIERAVRDRYSLKSIYTYLHNKKIISCNYRNFCRLCRSYIFNNASIKTVKNAAFTAMDSNENSTETKSSSNSQTVGKGEPINKPKVNSFDNWDGDSRKFRDTFY
ncbi:MAG: hypothetical protein IJ078_05765 [Succinivibrionaceae bacterium]|nr:hypothetical protein [Succinivibrionaceae bacterium]